MTGPPPISFFAVASASASLIPGNVQSEPRLIASVYGLDLSLRRKVNRHLSAKKCRYARSLVAARLRMLVAIRERDFSRHINVATYGAMKYYCRKSKGKSE